MGLTKCRLGDCVELYAERCGIENLTEWDVSGVNKDKEFFEPSKQVGADTSNYKVVPVNYFACNLMHVGRDVVLPIALNHTTNNKYVSPAYTIFKIKENTQILKEYFFIMLKSDEKDRYFWFHTDSSIRDGMSWEDFCDVEFYLPPLDIQQKYVDVYKAMLANQQSYERGLDDLKLTCDAYINQLKNKWPLTKLGCFIVLSEEKNNGHYNLDDVKGVSIEKEFIDTKANMQDVSLSSYTVIKPDEFAYVADTSRRGDKIALAFNNKEKSFLISSIYTVFEVCRPDLLDADYLFMYFNRPEFDRYARFHSWGSARETFDWEEMCNVKIPIPSLNIQQDMANIHKAYLTRKDINEKLKEQIKSICPILIKGSIEEARKREEA